MMSGISPMTPVYKTTSHRPSVFDINFNTNRFVKQTLNPQFSWMENLTPIQINNNNTTTDNTNYTSSTNNDDSTPLPPSIQIITPNSINTTTGSLYSILDHFYKKGI